jgi:glycine dehydrogenase subunit 1
LLGLVDSSTACVVVQSPNFFGEMEDLQVVAELVHEAGALLIVVANPISLGLFKPPGDSGADIVVGEGQPLGVGLNYGGPYLGFFACRMRDARKMAGRLVGQTVDTAGRRAFVLTLATREQHIRRERASSNICTNQSLCALAAAVYLAAMGRCGLRQVAELCYHKAHYAATRLAALPGYSLVTTRPFFNEFVIKCPRPVAEVNDHLLRSKIIGGYDLSREYPQMESCMLVCVTELNTREQIDQLAEELREVAR